MIWLLGDEHLTLGDDLGLGLALLFIFGVIWLIAAKY